MNPTSGSTLRTISTRFVPLFLLSTSLIIFPCASAMASAQKVFCFGDSLTAGTSPPLNEEFPYAAHLERTLRSEYPLHAEVLVRWKGFPGWTAPNLQQEGNLGNTMDNIEANAGPLDLVIILAGTNDLAHETDSETIVNSIKQIHNIAHAKKVKTLCLGIPPSAWQTQSEDTREVAESVNSKLKSWAMGDGQGSDSRLVGFAPFPIVSYDNSSGLWCGDGLHLSPLGYKFVGENLAPIIANILSESN